MRRNPIALSGLVVLATISLSATPSFSLPAGGFQWISHDASEKSIEKLRSRAAALQERVARVLGAGEGSIQIHVYESLESKGLETGYTMSVHSYSGRGQLHVSAEPGVAGEFERELASLLIRRRLGRTTSDVLAEGLALGFVENWGGEPPLYWAARLADMAGPIPLGRLTGARRYRKLSPLLRRPLASALTALIVDRGGWPALRRAWQTGEISPGVISAWPGWLESLVSRYPMRAGAKNASDLLPARHRGFCFAHEGYNVHDGYISRSADRALDRLVDIGSNAISVTPFSYMRDVNRPAQLPFSDGAGSENDESVIHATRSAHARGMSVMLKPHLWIPRSWPGGVEMQTPDDWNRFFKYYEEWILHYAMLAEMTNSEILCVGVELVQTTLDHEDAWVRMIDRVRKVYGGKITYAANWGEEYENIAFWSALDFAGINCYYPLDRSADATDDDLRAGAQEVIRKIDSIAAKWNVPVLITEVGFTSTVAPWISPHERPRGVPVDEMAQARSYEAFFSALQGSKSVVGVYWWKWPSFLEYGGEKHAGFTPNGKAAEQVVRRWFESIGSGGGGGRRPRR